jgi:hypothetical protein
MKRAPIITSILMCSVVATMAMAGCSGTGISAPSLSAISPQHVYVGDFKNPGSITMFLAPLVTGAASTGSLVGANAPASACFDASGTMYVPNFFGHTIQAFTQPITSGKSPAFQLADPNLPEDCAVELATGRLFVATASSGIDVYSAPITSSSTILFTITTGGGRGLSFDAAGNLYSANGAHIEKFTPPYSAGSTSVTFGTPNGDHGLAFDSSGRLFVASGHGFDVYLPPFNLLSFSVADPDGFATEFLAVDRNNNVYVADDSGVVYMYASPQNSSAVPGAQVSVSSTLPGIAVGP